MATSSKKETASFILASGSPRRKNLLRQFGFPFQVKPSGIEESFNRNDAPVKIVQKLALAKALAIADGTSSTIVLGADTVVVHENIILGKPENKKHACKMLSNLSNATHQVFSGVALVRTDRSGKVEKQTTFVETTLVSFGKIKEADIKKYVAGGSPMDKAGAYGIQDFWGTVFVKRIEGDYYNIVGLPMHSLYKNLENFAPELLK